jgi:hypothetical protein
MIGFLLAAVLGASDPVEIVGTVRHASFGPKEYRPAIEITSGVCVPISFSVEKGASATYSLYRLGSDSKIASTVAKDHNFAMVSSSAGASDCTINMDLPKSSVTGHYLLRLKVRRSNQPDLTEDFDLFSYPSDLPEQLQTAMRNFEKDTGEKLGVFGRGQKIRDLLTEWKIPYREYDPYGTRMSVVVGDFIGENLDADRLPEGSAVNALFLTATHQVGHTGDYTRSVIQGSGKTVYASEDHFADLNESPAAQYEFYSLLMGILPHPNP